MVTAAKRPARVMPIHVPPACEVAAGEELADGRATSARGSRGPVAPLVAVGRDDQRQVGARLPREDDQAQRVSLRRLILASSAA